MINILRALHFHRIVDLIYYGVCETKGGYFCLLSRSFNFFNLVCFIFIYTYSSYILA